MVEPWIASLEPGNPEAAWHRVIERYRRGIPGATGHSGTVPDDGMDVFASVREALRKRDFLRLCCAASRFDPGRVLSTRVFLIARKLAADWSRHRPGRRRLTAVAATLPHVQQRIFRHVFLEQYPSSKAWY